MELFILLFPPNPLVLHHVSNHFPMYVHQVAILSCRCSWWAALVTICICLRDWKLKGTFRKLRADWLRLMFPFSPLSSVPRSMHLFKGLMAKGYFIMTWKWIKNTMLFIDNDVDVPIRIHVNKSIRKETIWQWSPVSTWNDTQYWYQIPSAYWRMTIVVTEKYWCTQRLHFKVCENLRIGYSNMHSYLQWPTTKQQINLTLTGIRCDNLQMIMDDWKVDTWIQSGADGCDFLACTLSYLCAWYSWERSLGDTHAASIVNDEDRQLQYASLNKDYLKIS